LARQSCEDIELAGSFAQLNDSGASDVPLVHIDQIAAGDFQGFFFAADTRLSGSEYSADKIMVYPNGRGGAWAGANYSEATVAEDLQFVWDLLADVRANFCVDSARIYATGMSIGGGFVNTIACNDTVGGEFAAFAPASGSFYTDNDEHYEECTPAREVTPIVEIHGGADADVKYEGGEGQGGQNPGIADW
jgi:poly(3-hydroxybutyrate) depolymerase